MTLKSRTKVKNDWRIEILVCDLICKSVDPVLPSLAVMKIWHFKYCHPTPRVVQNFNTTDRQKKSTSPIPLLILVLSMMFESHSIKSVGKDTF